MAMSVLRIPAIRLPVAFTCRILTAVMTAILVQQMIPVQEASALVGLKTATTTILAPPTPVILRLVASIQFWGMGRPVHLTAIPALMTSVQAAYAPIHKRAATMVSHRPPTHVTRPLVASIVARLTSGSSPDPWVLPAMSSRTSLLRIYATSKAREREWSSAKEKAAPLLASPREGSEWADSQTRYIHW
jgi:hypothetical protein